MSKHARVDTLCITECTLWVIYRCKNMHFTKNIKFQIKNLTKFGFFSILELFQLLQMRITQNICIALQNTTNATVSGKSTVHMLELSTTVTLSGKEIVASHDK
jgi:hypothetical protein